MPSKRNLKNYCLVEIIQPKNYMALVNEKLDYHTKQLIFDYYLQDQEQSTHKELKSYRNKHLLHSIFHGTTIHNYHLIKYRWSTKELVKANMRTYNQMIKLFDYLYRKSTEENHKKDLENIAICHQDKIEIYGHLNYDF